MFGLSNVLWASSLSAVRMRPATFDASTPRELAVELHGRGGVGVDDRDVDDAFLVARGGDAQRRDFLAVEFVVGRGEPDRQPRRVLVDLVHLEDPVGRREQHRGLRR